MRKIDSELLDEVRVALGVKVGHIVEIAKQLVAERDELSRTLCKYLIII